MTFFPWNRKKAQEAESSLAPAKASLERLREERRAAAAEVEKTLKKILEIKEAPHGRNS